MRAEFSVGTLRRALVLLTKIGDECNALYPPHEPGLDKIEQACARLRDGITNHEDAGHGQ